MSHNFSLDCAKPKFTSSIALILFVLIVVHTPSALAALPAGEFQANTFTAGQQFDPAVAMDASGNFVVVWESQGQDGSDFGVYGQRYNSLGIPQGSEFRVNSFTNGVQWHPAIAMAADGKFVVVWESFNQFPPGPAQSSNYDIVGQLYDSAGVAQGGEFRINTFTNLDQQKPSVAMDASGNFVVVWESEVLDGSESGIYGKRYNSAGVAQTGDFQINTTTAGGQREAHIGMNKSGAFVVAWMGPGTKADIYAQRYNSAGVAQGGEFRVNTLIAEDQIIPAVAVDATGAFMIVWKGFTLGTDPTTNADNIYGQHYNSAGVSDAGELILTNSTGHQSAAQPSITVDAHGNFIVIWTFTEFDPKKNGIHGRRINSSGIVQGAEFTLTDDVASVPVLAMDEIGHAVAVWGAFDLDGSSSGIFGRLFNNVSTNAPSYNIAEGAGSLDLLVNRSGDPSLPISVDYLTSDSAAFLQNCNITNGAATSRCDYVGVLGTLHFAAGETSKTISIPIVDDTYLEGSESFFISLSNPAGGALLGANQRATIQITDNGNDVTGVANPIDDKTFFVRQHYIDFLSREPDPLSAGWVAILNGCGAADQSCRLTVSQGIYGSPEFRERGYFIYKFFSVGLGRKPSYDEFNLDRARVSGFQTEAELEQSKVDFIADFMSRAEFANIYTRLSNDAYVQRLYDTAGVTQVTVPNVGVFDVAQMQQRVASGRTRAQVLREIAESPEVSARFLTESTVVMHYFGYLRRDPDAAYQGWINILNSTGDSRNVTSGFINSPEYRARFGQ